MSEKLKPTAENHGEFWWVKDREKLEVVEIFADTWVRRQGRVAFFWAGNEVEGFVDKHPELVWLGRVEPPKVEEDV